jgi:hypothetical protein
MVENAEQLANQNHILLPKKKGFSCGTQMRNTRQIKGVLLTLLIIDVNLPVLVS